MSGPVLGAQTVQRAALFGAVVAAGAARGPLRIITDSQYVARNIAKLRAWPWPPEWRCADPWRLFWHAAKLGALAANWIPAHRPRPEPPLFFCPRMAWEAIAMLLGKLTERAVAVRSPFIAS